MHEVVDGGPHLRVNVDLPDYHESCPNTELSTSKRKILADKSSTPKKKLKDKGEADLSRTIEEGDNTLCIPVLDSDISTVGSDKADIELSVTEAYESPMKKSGIDESVNANIDESERAVLFDMLKGYNVTR